MTDLSTTPGKSLLDVVLDDLTTESGRLDALVADLPDEGWRTPTPSPGWDVATQIAHLAWTDEAAHAAATDKERWDALVLEALADPDRVADEAALAGGAAEPSAILERWRTARRALAETLRTYPSGQRIPWYGPPMSATSMATARFMETWAHGLDVHHALGAAPEVTDRIRHVAHLGVRARDFAYSVHGMQPPDEEFRVDLAAPSGEVWSWGPDDAAQTVTGPAYDFCLLVTQRINRADTSLVATGRDAWLEIAQAFAGPSGDGRAARDG
jgi:uncharacterized protein (TIGR03084 family)